MDLKNIYSPISEELLLVEKKLQDHKKIIIGLITQSGISKSNSRFVRDIIDYFFGAPGKLLRPALVLLSAKASGGKLKTGTKQLINAAAAVELIHGVSLIHDDVIDDTGERRSQVTLNNKFGNHTAIIAGDILYAHTFSLLSEMRTSDCSLQNTIIRLLVHTTRKMCLGELFELHKTNFGKSADLREYLQIIKNKTASLMSACCELGTLLTGANQKTTLALKEYGFNFGISYQLMDDITDGDFVVNSRINMARKAKEYSKKAQKSIHLITDSPSKQSLENLSGAGLKSFKV